MKQIKGYNNVQYDKEEQKMMKEFSKVATNGWKWRIAFKLLHIITPFLPFIIHIKIIKKSLFGKWLLNHELPVLNGNLYTKVKKIKGIIYE